VANYTTENIRNIALVGHAGSGKTLLSEALLHSAGAIQVMGSIERGSTVSDHNPLEKKHGHSLTSSVLSLDHGGCHVNIIDTPGYPDFLGSALSVLSAVETVAVVINAHAGIETTSRRLMDWSEKSNQCRMIIINHIDGEGVDLEKILADVRGTFGNECLAINLPAENGKKIVDCFFNPEGDADFSSVEEAHTAIIDQTIEVDEGLMETYLETGEVDPEALHDAFEQALREGHLVPVCFVSASTGVGVKELLEVIERLMPNPLEGNIPKFINGEGEEATEVKVIPDPDLHALGHVVKIEFDPFVGKLGVFRMHQGKLSRDSQLYIGEARKSFKASNLFKIQGGEHNNIDHAVPGDICAIAKVDGVFYDAVLHDSHDEDHIHLLPLTFPQPMVGLAIQPKKRGDEQKVFDALHRMVEEDPCLVLEQNAAANETVIRGLGDLHLRVTLERMAEQSNVEVITSRPTIPYRETVLKSAEGHHRHKKQTGGAGQFGEVFLRIAPNSRGSGFEFIDKVVGGAIPSQFIASIEKGIRQVLDQGAFAGFPLQDIEVTVYDGKFHSVDSKEIAFITAGKKAFIDAVLKARPVVLEPIVDVEVIVPAINMGDITGDLSSRRGRVGSTDALPGGMMAISGRVPLAEMDDYLSSLKSISGGEGSFTMELASYEAAPAEVQRTLSGAFKSSGDE